MTVYDLSVRELAADLFERGLGRDAAARALGAPAKAVRQWHLTYHSVGRGGLLSMGTHRRYDWETKVAAARAVVDAGRAKPEVMAELGIASKSPLDAWCRACRESGAEVLRPRPKDRPRGAAPATREEELEREVRRLKAQVAYQKIDSPKGRAGLPGRVRVLAVRGLSGRFDLAGLLAAASLPGSTHYHALSHPRAQTGPDLRGRVAEIFAREPDGAGHRRIAMEPRAVDGARVTDKTVLKVMRELGLRCDIRRETDYHRYNSYRGVVGETFGNPPGRDLSADGPWQKLGTDAAELRCSSGKAHLAPAYGMGSKEIVAWPVSESPNLAQRMELLDGLQPKVPEGASPVIQTDMGWQYRHELRCSRLQDAGVRQGMGRKGDRLDNAATEQVFGHIKDEFFRGRDWGDFGSFKRDLDAYIVRWNTVRRQVGLKGLTPAEFREQALREDA